MYLKIIINLLLLIIISIIQLSFINGLPSYFTGINIVIIAMVFIVGLNRFDIWFWWAFGFGLFFDFYAFLPFGFHLFVFPLINIVISFFLVNYLTDRSFYSFVILLFLFLFFYKISLFFLYYFLYFFNFEIIFSFSFYDFLISCFVNFILIAIIYSFLNITTNILKPVFLVKR